MKLYFYQKQNNAWRKLFEIFFEKSVSYIINMILCTLQDMKHSSTQNLFYIFKHLQICFFFFRFWILYPIKEAGCSTKKTHQIFHRFLDMICLAINHHLVMKNHIFCFFKISLFWYIFIVTRSIYYKNGHNNPAPLQVMTHQNFKTQFNS